MTLDPNLIEVLKLLSKIMETLKQVIPGRVDDLISDILKLILSYLNENK